MLDRLVNVLSSEGDLSAEEVADVLWLASIRYERVKPTPDEKSPTHKGIINSQDRFESASVEQVVIFALSLLIQSKLYQLASLLLYDYSKSLSKQIAKNIDKKSQASTETQTSFQAGIFPKSAQNSEQTASFFD